MTPLAAVATAVGVRVTAYGLGGWVQSTADTVGLVEVVGVWKRLYNHWFNTSECGVRRSNTQTH